ncbi:MAG: nucleoside triphosphate pyrophosphatase [Hyphomicrobiales bacterium]|jgi:septum formation protein|nr:nucleoside triphosphate pyrophosphatase [Hyphomicrobiales bacterium]
MSLWLSPEPLILASQSKVRRALLEAAGIPVEARPAHLDERAIEQGVTGGPGEVALTLAREKARTVAAMSGNGIVVGCDQTLALGARRFSKPGGRAAARQQLLALRGKTHELHSAVAVCRNGAVTFGHVAVARLTMRAFSEEFLDSYLDAAGVAVTASVGAYQLERTGIHLFERIEGDHFTILGLPLLPLLEHLRGEKVLAA